MGVITPVHKPSWKHINEIREEGIQYLHDRLSGKSKSVKTPWDKFDDACIGGIEWGSIIGIAGRPGTGKTAICNLITRGAPGRNPTQNIAVLDFQFEMSFKSTAIREFSAALKREYKQLLNADPNNPLYGSTILDAINYTKLRASQAIYQVDTPMTLAQLEVEIDEFMAFIKTPTIITIDHTILLKKGSGEKDKFEMLYNLGELLTKLKKKYPVIFIILTQMNRSIEALDRKANGTIGNYPNTGDIFGADALLMHCDMMIALNKPSEFSLTNYGPDNYEVTENLLAMHFLKARNTKRSILFFNADFEHMNVNEIANVPMLPPAGGTSAGRIGNFKSKII